MTARPSVRRLPFRLEPVEGEALWSYLERLASFANTNISSILTAVGLTEDMPKMTYPIYLPNPFRIIFAEATRLDVNTVEKMLFTSYIDKAISAKVVKDYEETYNRGVLAISTWTKFPFSSVCPECVRESHGAWKLEWMMPWSFACVKHKVLLRQYCPECHRLLGPKNHFYKFTNVHEPFVPRPGFCNYLHKSPATKHKDIRLCGYALTRMPTTRLDAWPALLESQASLDRAMEGKPMMLAGSEISSVKYLQAIRRFCSLVKRLVEPKYVGELPEELQLICKDYLTDIRKRPPEGHEVVGSLPHFHNKATMAAILSVATQIASAPSPTQLILTLVDLYKIIHKKEESSLKVVRYFLNSELLPNHFIVIANKLLEQKLHERIGRDGGLFYDFSEKKKVVDLNAERNYRRRSLSPNLVEALQQQVRENEELSVSEHINLFEVQQGVRVKSEILRDYLRRLGFRRQLHNSTGKMIWREV